MLISLWKHKDAVCATEELFRQQQNLEVLINVIKLMNTYQCELTNNSEFYLQLLIDCISANLNPSNSKIDAPTVELIEECAQLAIRSHCNLLTSWDKIIPNPNLVAWAMVVASIEQEESELMKQCSSLFPQKWSTSSIAAYGTLRLMARNQGLENAPSLKTIISWYKSIGDKNVLFLLGKFVLDLISSNMILKEIPSLIGFMAKRFKACPEAASALGCFVVKYLEVADATQNLKHYERRLMKMLLRTCPIESAILPETRNPSACIRQNLGQDLLMIIRLLQINPFDMMLVHEAEIRPLTVLGVVAFLVKNLDSSILVQGITQSASSFSQVIDVLKRNFFTHGLLITIAESILNQPNKKLAIALLVEAIEKGSVEAAESFLASDIPFNLGLQALSRALKPGKSPPLLAETIRSYLEAHVPEVISGPSMAKDTDTMSSSSSNFDLSTLEPSFVPVEDTEDVLPTDETILFCNILVSIQQFHELFTLLTLAAWAISPAFSKALQETYPEPTKRKYQYEALSSFGNALQFLDSRTVSSIAHTLLMQLPLSIQFLGICLQRLGHDIIDKSFKAMLPFLAGNADSIGRTVALVAYAHPDASIAFIEMVLSSLPVRRRFFLFSKYTECTEDILMTIFRTIGYCSSFLDIVYFKDHFLPFATKVLNKWLTHESKSIALYMASLFCIKKLSVRLKVCQCDYPDHVFPFKDFLVQYVCSYYTDVSSEWASGGDMNVYANLVAEILISLSSLLPLRPLRLSDHHEESVRTTDLIIGVIGDLPERCSKAVALFYHTLLECVPSLSVFTSVVLGVFPGFVFTNHWNRLCSLMRDIVEQSKDLDIQLGSDILSKIMDQLGLMISYALPLTVQESCGPAAALIIKDVIHLQCCIRNRVLSLPLTIIPHMNTFENLNGKELSRAVCESICKHCMTSQVFEIILSLADILVDERLVETHILGIYIAIKFLLKGKGNEEFRFDAKIISTLIKGLRPRDDKVIHEFLEIMQTLMSMRMFSVCSTLVDVCHNSDNLSDDLLASLVPMVAKFEGGIGQLANVVATSLSSCENHGGDDLCFRCLRLMAGYMKLVDDKIWAQLLAAVTKLVPDINDDLFKALAGNQDYHSTVEFARLASDDHMMALPYILADFPPISSPIHVELALSFAACSEESCCSFLEYSLTSLTKDVTSLDVYAILSKVFEGMSYEVWESQVKDLTDLFIKTLQLDSRVVDCCCLFISRLSEDNLHFFWWSLVRASSNSIDKWTDIIAVLLEKSRVSLDPLSELVPQLIVRGNADLLRAMAKSLSIDTTYSPDEICRLIVKSDVFKSKVSQFLETLVSMLDDGLYVVQCAHMIDLICEELNGENFFAVKTLVGRMASGKGRDNDGVANLLVRLLQ